MNNSFEQFFKKTNNKKNVQTKNLPSTAHSIKKQQKSNALQKNKNNSLHNQQKFKNQHNNKSVMSNYSSQKNYQGQSTKSNHKRLKRQQNNESKNKGANCKKYQTVQLTKKQIQIRQAIQYRFEKSKMKNYHLGFNNSQSHQLKIRQILDLEQEQYFQQNYQFLKQLKVVNLYDYHHYKDLMFQKTKEGTFQKNDQTHFKKDKTPNILVIKDNKKRRQNSDTMISYHDKQSEDNNKNGSKRKLVLNNINNHNININPSNYTNQKYLSNSNFQMFSQRNHTDSSSYQNKSKQVQSIANYFKLQFPKSNRIKKEKSGSRNKVKNEQSLNLNQKINFASSSVDKNFKSIKDIYLNAISNLANKNTLKSKSKLFKSDNQLKNKGSKSLLFESEKKPLKSQYSSNKPQKNYNSSSSALYQNYFSCISSRQNKKQSKMNSSHQNRRPTKQKLDKTLLINEANPTQWKSIIMKIGNSSRPDINELKSNKDVENANQSKKIKFKQKQQGLPSKLNKKALQISQNKYVLHHPHSYRQYTKSPKLKRYVIDDQIQKKNKLNKQDRKEMNSAKNLSNLTYQTIVNSSQLSDYRDSANGYKRNKK